MPSKSEKQRRYMGMDYARAKAGKKTKTGMSKSKLREYASKVESGKKVLGYGKG